MFRLNRYEDRLLAYNQFRLSLESSKDPLHDVIKMYEEAPTVTINADPWDQNSWMTPWELIYENEYCDYCKILGMCYTIQLTDKLKDEHFEIHICIDRSTNDRLYLLFVGDQVLGYYSNTYIHKDELPDTLYSETVYEMPALQ